MTIVVSSAPGGGYDAVGRNVARHIRKHIPGNPTVVVQNMGGVGGLVAANHVYNIVPRDGLTIAQFQNILVTGYAATFTTPTVRFENSFNSVFTGVSTVAGTLNIGNLVCAAGILTATEFRGTNVGLDTIPPSAKPNIEPTLCLLGQFGCRCCCSTTFSWEASRWQNACTAGATRAG